MRVKYTTKNLEALQNWPIFSAVCEIDVSRENAKLYWNIRLVRILMINDKTTNACIIVKKLCSIGYVPKLKQKIKKWHYLAAYWQYGDVLQSTHLLLLANVVLLHHFKSRHFTVITTLNDGLFRYGILFVATYCYLLLLHFLMYHTKVLLRIPIWTHCGKITS